MHLLSFWKTNQAPCFGLPLVDHSISISRIPHGVRFWHMHRLTWNLTDMGIRFFFSSANLSWRIPSTLATFSWLFRQNRCAYRHSLYRCTSKVSCSLYRISTIAYMRNEVLRPFSCFVHCPSSNHSISRGPPTKSMNRWDLPFSLEAAYPLVQPRALMWLAL